MKKNEQNFKHGDKTKYIGASHPELTHGKVYTFDRYHPDFDYVIIQGLYDNGYKPLMGEFAYSFVLFKPKNDRKKYTLVYSEHGSGGYSLPKLKKIKVKDIKKYLAKTDLDVQYVIKGHVTLV